MKKTLAIVLTFSMILALIFITGCEEAKGEPSPAASPVQSAGGAEDSAPTGETTYVEALGVQVEVVTSSDGTVTYSGLTKNELESALPNEYILEKLAADMKPLVAFSAIDLTSSFMNSLNEGMKATFTADGFEYSVADCESDSAVQMTQMENFISMRPSVMIVISADSGDSVGDLLERVVAEGIYVAVRGTMSGYDISVNVVQDQGLLGQAIGNMAIAWVDAQYGKSYTGVVKTALFYLLAVPDFVTRYNEIVKILEADSRIEVVYENSGPVMTTDAGYTAAEEANTFDSGIRMYICTTAGASIGVSNYLMTLPGINTDEYAVLASDSTAEAIDLIDMSASGGSVFRGLCNTGGDNPSIAVSTAVYKLITGELIPPAVYTDVVYSYNSFGYVFEGNK